jgi:solute carrier family 35 protein E1
MKQGALKQLSKIAAFHTLGHTMTVVSLGAGAVSFTHIVKAAEPFFSTIMSAIFLGSVFPWQVYATLLPIVAGVSIASMKELSFSWVSFLNAMGSNTAFSLRAIFSKKEMQTPPGENFSPANLYAVLTIISFVGLLPVALLSEGSRVAGAMSGAIKYFGSEKTFWTQVLTSGISYYLYK